MKWTTNTFGGGHLSTVMAHTMLTGKAREAFLTRAGEPGARDDSARKAFATIYGWSPPAELGQWQSVAKAYAKSSGAISDVWMLGDPISYAPGLAKSFTLDKLINAGDFWLTALTGLEMFGSDPCGDSCFVGTLASGRDDGAEVHVFNHENGELDGSRFGSIASFIASYFSPGSSDDEDGEGSDEHPWSAAAAKYDETFENSLTSRPAWVAADQLFSRSHWLMDLPTGEKGFELARKLASAPPFAVWLEERPRLIEHPVLIHYWIMAHYFIGNVEACREAIAIGKKAPGRVGPALAGLVEGLLDKPETAAFGKLSAKTLAKLGEAVRKNVAPELLEPAVGAATSKTKRSGKEEPSRRQQIQARLAAGEDPWALVAEFPDDVAVHDLALESIVAAKKDKELAARIKQYLGERTSEAYNTWPYDPEKYDRRFNTVVAAAFRSGLRYDADHSKAYAGITRTLAIADDDGAMAAFEQAIDELSVDDDRVQYVIEGLASSAHPRAGALLERAAQRFFATLEDAKERNDKSAKEGPTLDNMFRVDSHFAEALRVALRRDDDIAVRLAEKTLSFYSSLQLFGTALGLAVNVLARRGQASCRDWAEAYAAMVVDRRSGSEWIEDIAQANVAECAIAIARLAPREYATAFLHGRFTAKRKHLQADLAIRGALLAGLLVLDPKNAEYRGWVERLLGNRTGAFSIFSVLRGIEESGADIPASWVLPHVYAERTSLSESQTGEQIVQEAARRALAVLGAPPPPPFDDSDVYANRTPDDALPAAILRPDRHRLSNVFERIREKKVVRPDIAANGGAVLRDLYAWSSDESDRIDNRARVEGLRAMRLQGPPAAPALAALLELPHMSVEDRGYARVTLRYCGQEAVVRRWLRSASIEEVLAELTRPTASFIAFPDLLAAHAVARTGDRATEACLAAVERRLADAPRASDYAGPGDPALTLLPFVVGSLGDDARTRLRVLAKSFDSYRSARAVLLQAARFEPVPLSHDWNGPLAVEAACAGESVRYRAELSLEGDKLVWESTTEGFEMNQIIEESHSERGTLDFESADAARAFADLELRALSLRGFHRPAPKKSAKTKTTKRR